MKKLVWFRAILILPTRERPYVTANLKILAWLIAMVVACVKTAYAADVPKVSAHEERGIAERISEAAENMGKKIEQAVNGVVKKLEEQRVGERLGETIKNVATRTGEELERVAKKDRGQVLEIGMTPGSFISGLLAESEKSSRGSRSDGW